VNAILSLSSQTSGLLNPDDFAPSSSLSVDFSADPLSGYKLPVSVQFTDLSIGALSWLWSFGDGSPHSTDQNPTHAYTAVGTYSVSLTGRNGSGLTDSITKTNYISIISRLSTKDVALPLNRPELRTMYVEGMANYVFINRGVRGLIPRGIVPVSESGFRRAQGPTIVFD
jgi:PKD repeat protein